MEKLEVFRVGRVWMGDVVDEGDEVLRGQLLLLPLIPSKIWAGTLRGVKKFNPFSTELPRFQLRLGKKIQEEERVKFPQFPLKVRICSLCSFPQEFSVCP